MKRHSGFAFQGDPCRLVHLENDCTGEQSSLDNGHWTIRRTYEVCEIPGHPGFFLYADAYNWVDVGHESDPTAYADPPLWYSLICVDRRYGDRIVDSWDNICSYEMGERFIGQYLEELETLLETIV